jgi:peroxiredoxin
MTVQIGTPAPAFSLQNQFGQTIALRDFMGRRPVVLVFFPLAFSVTCTSELSELKKEKLLFDSVGAELLGVSVDSNASLRAFADAEGIEFSLLSDFWPHGAVAADYGVLLEDRGHASRTTFVIDADGFVRASFSSELGSPRSMDQYRSALESLRVVD